MSIITTGQSPLKVNHRNQCDISVAIDPYRHRAENVLVRRAVTLAKQARWLGSERCTWLVPDLRAPASSAVEYRLAGPDLYSGTAGIAYTLACAAKYAESKQIREAALGAYRYSYDAFFNSSRQPDAGLFSGISGLLLVAEVLEQSGANLEGHAVIDIVKALGQISLANGGSDVITGNAGLVLALLRVDRNGQSLHAEIEDILRRAGDALLKAAVVGAHGWSWVMMHSAARPLTGFAHGSAGVAAALLGLGDRLEETRFVEAAFAGFEHEDSEFSGTDANWYDLRNNALHDALTLDGNGTDAEKRAWLVQPWRPTFMNAWCHGAPGIALSRALGWQLTGEHHCQTAAITAIATTCAALEGAAGDLSLCHGQAGLALILHRLSAMSEDTSRSNALICSTLDHILRVSESGELWISGSRAGAPDAGLMCGDSGICLFLQAVIDHAARVPGFDLEGVSNPRPYGGVSWVAERTAQVLAPTAYAMLVRHGVEVVSSHDLAVGAHSQMCAVWDRVEQLIAETGFADVGPSIARERAIFAAAADKGDYGYAQVQAQRAREVEAPWIGSEQVFLVSGVRIVHNDVPAGLSIWEVEDDAPVEIVVVTPYERRIHTAGKLARLVLFALEDGATTVLEVVRTVAVRLSSHATGKSHEVVRARVEGQLRAFERAAVLRIDRTRP